MFTCVCVCSRVCLLVCIHVCVHLCGICSPVCVHVCVRAHNCARMQKPVIDVDIFLHHPSPYTIKQSFSGCQLSSVASLLRGIPVWATTTAQLSCGFLRSEPQSSGLHTGQAGPSPQLLVFSALWQFSLPLLTGRLQALYPKPSVFGHL